MDQKIDLPFVLFGVPTVLTPEQSENLRQDIPLDDGWEDVPELDWDDILDQQFQTMGCR
ncbi:MAG: hypothetical protein II177_05405 [Lachnospiraceae bacterium]|nr:hypothetical protein [Lachnospiraceae bacterium]